VVREAWRGRDARRGEVDQRLALGGAIARGSRAA
jgi:hypothetical protein